MIVRWREPGKFARRILLAGDISPNVGNIGGILAAGVDNIFRGVKPSFS